MAPAFAQKAGVPDKKYESNKTCNVCKRADRGMLLCSSAYFLATQNMEVNLLVLLNSLLRFGFSPNTSFHFALIVASQLQTS